MGLLSFDIKDKQAVQVYAIIFKAVSRLLSSKKVIMMLKFFLVLSILSQTLASDECSGPIEPGQPGLAWTKEELEVTRAKVTLIFKLL